MARTANTTPINAVTNHVLASLSDRGYDARIQSRDGVRVFTVSVPVPTAAQLNDPNNYTAKGYFRLFSTPRGGHKLADNHTLFGGAYVENFKALMENRNFSSEGVHVTTSEHHIRISFPVAEGQTAKSGNPKLVQTQWLQVGPVMVNAALTIQTPKEKVAPAPTQAPELDDFGPLTAEDLAAIKRSRARRSK